jgi:hypothetical protein
LVITLLGRWPVVGDQVGCPSPDGRRNLRFTVVEMRGRRLTKVRVDVATEGGQSRGPVEQEKRPVKHWTGFTVRAKRGRS